MKCLRQEINPPKNELFFYSYLLTTYAIEVRADLLFNLYEKVNPQNVKLIREEHAAEVLLLTACRLTKFKRPQLAIRLVKSLIDRDCDAKLIILGKGEMVDELQQLIKELNLGDRVFMKGYVGNVLEFMQAADYLVHPSVLDSSCVAVKEAGLVQLPPIVCRGIGDFEDYLIDGENGFLVNPNHFVDESTDVIVKSYQEKGQLETIGGNLKRSVLELFDVDTLFLQELARLFLDQVGRGLEDLAVEAELVADLHRCISVLLRRR
jgi:glycosyltransferase involved in cell wall biosynthesis